MSRGGRLKTDKKNMTSNSLGARRVNGLGSLELPGHAEGPPEMCCKCKGNQ